MPFRSEKQRRFFNANKGKIGEDVVDEFNEESKGKKLPESAGKKKTKKDHVRAYLMKKKSKKMMEDDDQMMDSES